jgi:hypothetical protein
MISWVVIVVLVILGAFAIKMNHLRHRFFLIILVGLAIFLYVTIYFVNIQNDLDFNSAEGLYKAGKIYMGWLSNSFQNMKAITGDALKMDWTSVNGSFLNKTGS